jgi:hypothetical protein
MNGDACPVLVLERYLDVSYMCQQKAEKKDTRQLKKPCK